MSLKASWRSSLMALLLSFWAISSSSSWSIWRWILWTFISPYSALLSASWSTWELCHFYFIYTRNWKFTWNWLLFLGLFCVRAFFFWENCHMSVALNFSFGILIQTFRRSIKCLIWSFRVSSLWCAFSSLTCDFFCAIFPFLIIFYLHAFHVVANNL